MEHKPIIIDDFYFLHIELVKEKRETVIIVKLIGFLNFLCLEYFFAL